MKTFVRKKRNPTRKRDPEQKRALILNAARELFAAQGYEDTPTAQIAELANVSEGALFHQFPTKRDLFFRLAEEYGQQCAAATMPGEPGEISAETIVRTAFEFAEGNRELYRFFSTVGPKLNENDETPMGNAIVAIIRKQIEWEMAQGITRDGNACLMAELQFAIVERSYSAWRKSGTPGEREEYIVEAARCMDAIAN
jgi:AcrR family transcriptional regulator